MKTRRLGNSYLYITSVGFGAWAVGGSVDLIMDFTDPVIRGMSLFQCHLLNHEDKGMMAKILFE